MLNNKKSEQNNWTQLAILIITGERYGSETAQELKPNIQMLNKPSITIHYCGKSK